MSQIKDFKIIKKLGEGAFSSVHQVKRISDDAVYALKKVKMGKLSEKEKQNAVNEIRILASINHPNVIGYKEAFFENKEGCLCIIMELADGGDLLQTIEQHKKQRSKFTEKQIWHYFIQIVRGLKALHDLKIVHRDIKCANLFITKEGVIKLGDLNVSKVAKMGLLSTQTGTPYYASPEIWKEKPYNNLSDIWSLGCVLYEMITLQPPFRAQSMQGLATKVMAGRYDRIPTHFTNDLHQMVKGCLQVTPAARPSCDKILATPGLLNHLTGTLEDLDIHPEDQEANDNLLKTIRCPRNLGMITDRLPAPQYEQPKLKRCNSQGIDSLAISKLEVNIENKDLNNQQIKIKSDNNENKAKDRRIGASRVLCNLPIIEEHQVDDETIDVLNSIQNQAKKVNQLISKQKKLNKDRSRMRLDYNSDSQKLEKQISQDSVPKVCQSEQRSRQGERMKPPMPQNPKSADIYSHKAKANNLRRVPSYQKIVGLPPSNQSERDDISTRVSSKSQAHQRPNYIHQKQNVNLDYQYVPHDSQTPRLNMNSNLDNVSRRPESQFQSVDAEIKYIQGSQLPHLKPNGRLNSVDLDKMEREQKLACYLAPPVVQSARANSRYQNNRNESHGVSRALGINHNRYEGVSNAIRLARAASKDSIPTYQQPRGPCPVKYMGQLQKVQSNAVLVSEIEKPVALLNRYQSEARNLPSIYRSRRLQADYDSHQGKINNYEYQQIPNAKIKQF